MTAMRRSRGIGAAALGFLAVLLIGASGARAADFLDPSFGEGGIAQPVLPEEASRAAAGIVDLAAAPGGGTAGALKGLAGAGYFGAVRLTAAGAPDPGFGPGGFTSPLEVDPWEGINLEAQGEAVAAQEDGKTVVAGYLQEGIRRPTAFSPLLARYQADGSLDPGFGDGGIVAGPRSFGRGGIALHGVAVAPGGRILAVGGRNERFLGTEAPAGVVLAYDPDGSVDSAFGQGGRVWFPQRSRSGYSGLRTLKILADGKILVAGYLDFRLFLARLNPGGGLDRTFGGGDGRVVVDIQSGTCCPTASLAVQGNGRIVVAANGGHLLRRRVFLARFLANGRLDRSFGDRGVQAPLRPWRLSEASDVAIQGDGGILTVGRSERTKRNPRGGIYAVFRNRPGGGVDRSFGNRGLRTFRFGRESLAGAALAQPDGGVLTAGSFAWADDASGRTVTRLLLVRLHG
jgi:uncharacterized delta-60 repeat protein